LFQRNVCFNENNESIKQQTGREKKEEEEPPLPDVSSTPLSSQTLKPKFRTRKQTLHGTKDREIGVTLRVCSNTYRSRETTLRA